LDVFLFFPPLFIPAHPSLPSYHSLAPAGPPSASPSATNLAGLQKTKSLHPSLVRQDSEAARQRALVLAQLAASSESSPHGQLEEFDEDDEDPTMSMVFIIYLSYYILKKTTAYWCVSV
jgi:hypothetical protein